MVKSKKDVFLEGTKQEKKKVHFATPMDGHLSFEECRVGNQITKNTKDESCSDMVKDDSGAYTVFTEQGSSASQMTAAKVMDVIARLPGLRRTSRRRSISLHPVKMEDAPRLLKIPKSECPDIWIRLPRHKVPKSWSDIEDPVVNDRNLCGHFLPLVERQGIGLDGENSTELEILLVHRKQGFKIGIRGHQNVWNMKAPMWKKLMELVDLDEPTSFLDIWDALNVNVNRTKTLSINVQKCSNHEFLPPQLKKISRMGETSRKKLSRGPTTWKDMRKSTLRGIVNWQTKRRNNCTQFERLAWMITTSRKRSWKQSENCPKSVLKLS